MPSQTAQQGFTLIELMVVVLIIAVLLSAGLVSLSPSDSALMRKQAKQLQGALQQTCDQAAFSQSLMALVPGDQGLSMQQLTQGKWRDYSGAQNLAWQAGIKATWEMDEMLAKAQKLTPPGWICWPSGEVLEGKVEFEMGDLQKTVRWNAILRFEKP